MKYRNIMAVIFLSIFTLGIYDLFWLVSVKKELNAKTRVHTPTLWLLFAPLILMLIALIVVVAAAASTSSSQSAAANAGASIAVVLVYLFAFLVIIPVTFYWFFKFSKAVNEYTNGEINTAVAFLLLWLLRFIGLAVIQDKFNDMLAADNTGTGLAPDPQSGPVQSAAPQAPTEPTPPQPTVDQTPTPPTPPQPPVSPVQ